MCLRDLVLGFVLGLISIFVPNAAALVLWIGCFIIIPLALNSWEAVGGEDGRTSWLGCLGLIITVVLIVIFAIIIQHVPTTPFIKFY